MSWSATIAEFAASASAGDIPKDVLERAALQVLDTIASAAGAHDAPPVEATRRVVAGSGPAEATVWFGGGKASVPDAILANGTAVRFLDVNDVFLGDQGPGGHPSDNIPVAFAFAEKSGASGRDLLAAIAVQYELTWRLRNEVFRPLPLGRNWDAVSISSPVSSLVAALLMGASVERATHALALGAVQGFVLREVRGGEISMTKAVANAMVARQAATAAVLAVDGLTAPPEAFEGRDGLVATLGGEPDRAILDAVCAPPEWAIRNISVKSYPAFGTAQAVIAAAAQAAANAPGGRFAPAELAQVTIRVPDSEWTRARREVVGLALPETRESADHSLSFLTVVALLHGTVTTDHYDRELWLDPQVQDLMRRTRVLPDPELTEIATTVFPGLVEVELTDGRALREMVVKPPGSPSSPFGWSDIVDKFARLDRTGLGRDDPEAVQRIADRVAGLVSAPGVGEVAEVLA